MKGRVGGGMGGINILFFSLLFFLFFLINTCATKSALFKILISIISFKQTKSTMRKSEEMRRIKESVNLEIENEAK